MKIKDVQLFDLGGRGGQILRHGYMTHFNEFFKKSKYLSRHTTLILVQIS